MKLRAVGYLASACLLHVATFALVARLHAVDATDAATLASQSSVVEADVDVDVERAHETAREVDTPPPPSAAAPAGAKTAPRSEPLDSTSATASELPARAGTVGSAAPATSGEPGPSDATWSFPTGPARGGPVAIGDLLGSKGIPIPPAPIATAVAEAPPARGVSKTGGLIEGLDQADLAKGQGRGGAVLAGVEAAARSSDAPTTGRAIYDVTVDHANVVTVSLVGASEDPAGWSNLTAAITAVMRNKRTRVPPGARALRVRVEIDAAVKYPDGRDVRSLGAGVDPKNLTIGVRGKVCSVGLNPLGVAGGCSPENIGGVAARVVSGRVLSETRVD